MASGIQPQEFTVALTTLWEASSTLTTNVPGGIALDLAYDDDAEETGFTAPAKSPYAVVSIDPEEVKIMATRAFVQNVGFTVTIYDSQPMDAAARATINKAINNLFCNATLNLTSGGQSCGSAWPGKSGGTNKIADSRRHGQNVVQTELSFTFMMQGSF
jgi:hypothetical protein